MRDINPIPRLSFFSAMGIIGLLAVHVGFAKTFILPECKATTTHRR